MGTKNPTIKLKNFLSARGQSRGKSDLTRTLETKTQKSYDGYEKSRNSN